ncbi:hypothetical protein [Microseira wollei]|nr:hypothetical protein [Microseira wollei]
MKHRRHALGDSSDRDRILDCGVCDRIFTPSYTAPRRAHLF